MAGRTKRIVIITGYFSGESYGLLGPQMAATIINDNTEYNAIVVAVTNEDDKKKLGSAIDGYFEGKPGIVAFSTLGGRQDLFEFAGSLKKKGFLTILAGPQAGADFLGETQWQDFSHRFRGLSDCFCFAVQGPAQQIIPLLESGPDPEAQISDFKGMAYKNENEITVLNPSGNWDDNMLSRVDWNTLYRLENGRFEPVTISCAQVLQQIGCQHAARTGEISIDYPFEFEKISCSASSVTLCQKGCSFCDVAADKGYMGALGYASVKQQLSCLPDGPDGRKIPFELINESPLPKLGSIFEMADELSISLSRINLTLRADYLLKGLSSLEKALKTAVKKDVRILLSSIGFESFDDIILKNLNKGVTRKLNLDAVKAIRSLKSRYPSHLGYLRQEGGNHGFIHPTPWDSPEISRRINATISMYRLDLDILPFHSTPLVIHHGSGLGNWIRRIEEKENIKFERVGTTIAWWQTSLMPLVL